MKGKLISTTNTKFKDLEGLVGDITITLQVWLSIEGRTPFRTSDIKTIEYRYESNGNYIVVTTLNSEYVFQLGVDK